MTVVAIVLGAGQGTRLDAGIPKALARVAGRTLLEWSAASLGRAPSVHAVLPVVPADSGDVVAELQASWQGPARLLAAVLGGETRQASADIGLRRADRELFPLDWVLVHDAARCLVLPEDAERVLARARETGAAIPTLEIGETVKEVEQGRVLRTVDRARLVVAQTPQAFRAALLREALDKAEREGVTSTDCASLVERLGFSVRTCAGRPESFKVTLPSDLERAEAVLGGPALGS